MAATDITLIQNDTNYYDNNIDNDNNDEWRWPTKTTVFDLNIEEQQLISTRMNKKKEKASRRKKLQRKQVIQSKAENNNTRIKYMQNTPIYRVKCGCKMINKKNTTNQLTTLIS